MSSSRGRGHHHKREDLRYRGFSGWMRKHKKAVIQTGIGVTAISLVLGAWYTAGMYQRRKAQEAMIEQHRLESLAAEEQQMEEEIAFQESFSETMSLAEPEVTWNGIHYRRNSYVKAVLCLGVDRKGTMTETTISGDGGQADGIFLLAYDTARNDVKILLIPRDTITEITETDISLTEKNGTELGTIQDHLSLSYAYGDGREKSCEYAKEAVSNLLFDMNIDYYMAADLDIINSLNDAVGGVEVTIPTLGMENADPEFVFGRTVLLKGDQAERFVRYRDITRDNSAIARMEQQKLYISGFFQAVKNQSKKESNIVENLFSMAQEYMVTDMAKAQYLKMAAGVIDGEGLTGEDFYMTPGMGTATETYDEYYVDYESLMPILLEMFYRED